MLLRSLYRKPHSRSVLLLCALLTIGCGLAPHSARSDDQLAKPDDQGTDFSGQYRAFYYNAKGELLQVESVSEAMLTTRTLEDVNTTTMTIPTLNGAVVPKITGANKSMSKFAVIAVYYTYAGKRPEKGSFNVQALPVKVEDLQWVHERTLETCLARSGNDPCAFPRRCHCMTGSCCCY
jgi:hypothetical protein